MQTGDERKRRNHIELERLTRFQGPLAHLHAHDGTWRDMLYVSLLSTKTFARMDMRTDAASDRTQLPVLAHWQTPPRTSPGASACFRPQAMKRAHGTAQFALILLILTSIFQHVAISSFACYRAPVGMAAEETAVARGTRPKLTMGERGTKCRYYGWARASEQSTGLLAIATTVSIGANPLLTLQITLLTH